MANNEVLPKGSTILITGANGFLASHCADLALAHGFKVRGTVRSIEKAGWLVELFDKKYGKGLFESVVVEDMAHASAFDQLIQECAAVMHCATVTALDSDPDKVISPTVAGALEILKSAAKTPCVKRVVYTSSQAALIHVEPDARAQTTQDSWNERDVNLAKDVSKLDDFAKPLVIYCASKTLAEQACFEFMKAETPHFVFNSVVPNFNTGPLLNPDYPSSTGGFLKGMWLGDQQATQMVKMFGANNYIDVRDDAALHLAAVMYDDIRNERLMGMVESFNFNDIIEVFKKIDPEHKLTERIEGNPKDLTTYDGVDRSMELLRRMGRGGWIGFEDSIRASIAGLYVTTDTLQS